jgi:HD-like signal output (HDOD) protein
MRHAGVSLEEAERLHDLPAHERLGGQLARLWKFPAALATPIEQHHAIHRLEVRERLVPHLRAITEVVAAADHVSHSCQLTVGAGASPLTAEVHDGEAGSLFERNGLSAAQLQAVRDRTCKQLERSKVFLSLLGG